MKGFRLFVILLSWHPDATRFVLPLTSQGWLPAGWPLPGTTKGFGSHGHLPFLPSCLYIAAVPVGCRLRKLWTPRDIAAMSEICLVDHLGVPFRRVTAPNYRLMEV